MTDDPIFTSRYDVVVMGRIIGSATAEEFNTPEIMFYDFVPSGPLTGDVDWVGDVVVDYDKGTINKYNSMGYIAQSLDLVPILSKMEPQNVVN